LFNHFTEKAKKYVFGFKKKKKKNPSLKTSTQSNSLCSPGYAQGHCQPEGKNLFLFVVRSHCNYEIQRKN